MAKAEWIDGREESVWRPPVVVKRVRKNSDQ